MSNEINETSVLRDAEEAPFIIMILNIRGFTTRTIPTIFEDTTAAQEHVTAVLNSGARFLNLGSFALMDEMIVATEEIVAIELIEADE